MRGTTAARTNYNGLQKQQWAEENRVFNCICKKNLSRQEEFQFAAWLNHEPFFIAAPSPSLRYVLDYFFDYHLGSKISSLPELKSGINTFLVNLSGHKNETWAIRLLI